MPARTFKLNLKRVKKNYITLIFILLLGSIFSLFWNYPLTLTLWLGACISYLHFKILYKQFIYKYEITKEGLKLYYYENSKKKTINLKNNYKISKNDTILQGKPSATLFISWREGTINQYQTGTWNIHEITKIMELTSPKQSPL